jgi:hypothetical protein
MEVTAGAGAQPTLYHAINAFAGKRMKASDVNLLASMIAVIAYRDGLLTTDDIERILTEFKRSMEG